LRREHKDRQRAKRRIEQENPTPNARDDFIDADEGGIGSNRIYPNLPLRIDT